MGFTPANVTQNFFVDSVNPANRGTAVSVSDIVGAKALKMYIKDRKMHDTNFAFLTTTLAKLHNQLYEPLYFITYGQDVPVDVGGGFVDYVEYYTVDWAGIMNEFYINFGIFGFLGCFLSGILIKKARNYWLSNKKYLFVNLVYYDIFYSFAFMYNESYIVSGILTIFKNSVFLLFILIAIYLLDRNIKSLDWSKKWKTELTLF